MPEQVGSWRQRPSDEIGDRVGRGSGEMLREATAYTFEFSLSKPVVALFKSDESQYVANPLAGIKVDRY